MEKEFLAILKKLIKEQGKGALTNPTKCKSLLRDYVKNEYKKETRFILLAIESGTAKAIDKADDLTACKKIQIRELQKEQGLALEIATDIVNALALVLRNDKTVIKPEISNAGKIGIGKTSASQISKFYNKGVEYFNNKNFDKAIKEFTKAIQQNPNNVDAYYWRANAYVEKSATDKNATDKAIADYSQAIRITPNDGNLYFLRGMGYATQGILNIAIADFEYALKIGLPDHTAIVAKQYLESVRRKRGW